MWVAVWVEGEGEEVAVLESLPVQSEMRIWVKTCRQDNMNAIIPK